MERTSDILQKTMDQVCFDVAGPFSILALTLHQILFRMDLTQHICISQVHICCNTCRCAQFPQSFELSLARPWLPCLLVLPSLVVGNELEEASLLYLGQQQLQVGGCNFWRIQPPHIEAILVYFGFIRGHYYHVASCALRFPCYTHTEDWKRPRVSASINSGKGGMGHV